MRLVGEERQNKELEIHGGEFSAHAERATAHASIHKTLAEASETPAAMMSAEI